MHNEHKELYDFLQEIHERIQLATRPKNAFPAICEFTHQVFSNPLLEPILSEASGDAKNNLGPLNKLKQQGFDEVIVTRKELQSYVSELPVIKVFLNECDDHDTRYAPMTWELAFNLDETLRRALYHIAIANLGNKTEILKKFCSLDEKGNITGYTFAPSLVAARREIEFFQKKNNTLLHSINQLMLIDLFYNPKKQASAINHFAQNKQIAVANLLSIYGANFDLALEKHDARDAMKLNFDVEEDKLHVHRVWHYIKPKLLELVAKEDSASLSAEVFYYTFSEANDLQKGVLISGSLPGLELVLVGNSALLVHLVAQKKNVSSHEAGELMPKSDASPKQRADSALRVANSGALKVFSKKKFMSSKRAIISANYHLKVIKSHPNSGLI